MMHYLMSWSGSAARRSACGNICALVAILYAPAVYSATIPGAVSVSIQPPEAIAAGAHWSIDGGAPQVSAASLSNLDAGTHTLQFTDLAAWAEPDSVEVLLIGGKLSTLTARYRPLPKFYFRSVPDQRARAGTMLEFLIHTDDPTDPQNPGLGTTLQMTATPPPAGPPVFNSASGRITYTPALNDRLPFTCG